jgi:hypothetical protein
MESSASGMNGRDRRVVGNADGDGSGSRDGSSRKGKRQSLGDRGIGIGYVKELEQRRMISRKRGREPHVVVHLNVEGRTEGMRERGMRMIEVAEVGSVDGCTRKQGRR